MEKNSLTFMKNRNILYLELDDVNSLLGTKYENQN